MSAKIKGYNRSIIRQPMTRIVAFVPSEDIDAVDAWGIASGKSSRTEAIRQIIKAGLKAEEVSGQN